METKEYTTRHQHGRDKWPPGEWDNEPDKVQWSDPATGLPCLIVRNHGGALCGYVGVPPGHAAHGRPYSEVTGIAVHGDLTFSDHCQPVDDEATGVCHLAAPGEPEPWWLGFDCSHAWDLTPAYQDWPGRDETYRNMAYVKRQVTELAAQLAAAA